MPMIFSDFMTSLTICLYLGSKTWRGRRVFGKKTTVDSGKRGTRPEKFLRLETSLRSSEDKSITALTMP